MFVVVFFKNGCSVRLLNPQTYSEKIWKLNVTLQEYFGSFVGANVLVQQFFIFFLITFNGYHWLKYIICLDI